jgi:hypothetical protein
VREAGFAKTMHPRNGVEGPTASWCAGMGLDGTKYRGLSRVSMLHCLMGGGLQRETILKSTCFPDENRRPEPRLRV